MARTQGLEVMLAFAMDAIRNHCSHEGVSVSEWLAQNLPAMDRQEVVEISAYLENVEKVDDGA